MEQKPTFITDDNPNKDINIAFFNLPLLKRYNFWLRFLICIFFFIVPIIVLPQSLNDFSKN